MHTYPYDASRESLFTPGLAENFFQLGAFDCEAALCAEMARLAYVKDERRLDTYLDRAEFTRDLALGYGGKGTQVFIATKPAKKLTVLSFRGTETDDPSDLFSDANFLLTPWVDGHERAMGQVHKGFAEALLTHRVLAIVIEHLSALDPGYRLLITGHSLGAALATLCASRLPPACLYTFGSPRVGDAVFAMAMRDVPHQRYVDCCDIVTRVPPEEFGYQHTGSLRYLDSRGQLLDQASKDQIDSDRSKASALYLMRQAFLRGNIFSRELADHAPINYVSATMGIRA